MVSVGLTKSLKNLHSDKVMVRSLQTIETLAYCNEIVAELRSPLGPGVEEAVNVLKNKMGINIRIATGDNIETAR